MILHTTNMLQSQRKLNTNCQFPTNTQVIITVKYDTTLDSIDIYPLVNYHSNGLSPFSIGCTSSQGPFSIAMLVLWSAYHKAIYPCKHMVKPGKWRSLKASSDGQQQKNWASGHVEGFTVPQLSQVLSQHYLTNFLEGFFCGERGVV